MFTKGKINWKILKDYVINSIVKFFVKKTIIPISYRIRYKFLFLLYAFKKLNWNILGPKNKQNKSATSQKKVKWKREKIKREENEVFPAGLNLNSSNTMFTMFQKVSCSFLELLHFFLFLILLIKWILYFICIITQK